MAGAVGSHLPSTWADRLRSPDRHSDPARDVSQALEIIPIANGEMKLASALIMSVQLTRTAIYLAAVIVFGSVRALIWAAVVQGVLQTGVLWWYLQSRFGGFWQRLDWSLMRSQLSYAVPLGLAGILYTVQTDLHC